MPQCDNSNILLLWLMKLAPQCANIVMGTLPKVINWLLGSYMGEVHIVFALATSNRRLSVFALGETF